MADEYIRKAEAIEAIGKEYAPRTDFERGMVSQMSCDKDKIRRLPSADVAPVRHARWERYSGITIRCSRCEHVIHDWRLPECKYCPNCGAKMDGEE